jgi:cytochrome c553
MPKLSALLLCALVAAAASAAARADEMARAVEIVQGKCFICHGIDGESASPLFPRLAGQSEAYVVRQLRDYKTGKRTSSAMQPMVADLDDNDFKALGRYFASRPTHVHQVEDGELARVGAYIYQHGNRYSGVAACAGCHGPSGHGTDALPRLAGQHALYTEKQIKEFNARVRTNDNMVMHTVASKLTELETKAVAAYLAGLK